MRGLWSELARDFFQATVYHPLESALERLRRRRESQFHDRAFDRPQHLLAPVGKRERCVAEKVRRKSVACEAFAHRGHAQVAGRVLIRMEVGRIGIGSGQQQPAAGAQDSFALGKGLFLIGHEVKRFEKQYHVEAAVLKWQLARVEQMKIDPAAKLRFRHSYPVRAKVARGNALCNRRKKAQAGTRPARDLQNILAHAIPARPAVPIRQALDLLGSNGVPGSFSDVDETHGNAGKLYVVGCCGTWQR